MKVILCLFPCWNCNRGYKYEGYMCNMQFNPDNKISKSNK